MENRPPEFDYVASRLAPILEDLPARIVALDGRCGVGKTTLGRFLAWYFNVTLIETDLYLARDGTLTRRLDEINRIIQFRLYKPRPVIVEGVGILQLLSELGRTPDFLAYVKNTRLNPEPDKFLLAYEERFAPWARADVLVELEHDG